MPALPGAYYLPFNHKLQLSTMAATALYFELTDEEVNWEDVTATAGFGLGMYGLWAPPEFKQKVTMKLIAPVVARAGPVGAAVAATLVAGDLISHQIDPQSGRENFRDFVNPFQISQMPERVAFTAETIYEHKIKEPLVEAAEWYVDFIDEGIRAVRLGWSIQPMPQLPNLPGPF